MEFLEKLYSQEYFAPVLFAVIAILAVLFIIILILALRDAKKRKIVDGGTNDAFAKVSEEPQEINVSVSNPETSEVKIEPEIKEGSVISNVEPSANGFENIEVPAPVVENNETPIVSEQSVDIPAPVQEEPQDIKLETELPAVNNEVEKAESDLDSIAATLLNEYKKDDAVGSSVEEPKSFSSVDVTPNTLPAEEVKNDVSFPNLNDIPVPQPVRVTETATVIDSSKQNVDNISAEEYNLK